MAKVTLKKVSEIRLTLTVEEAKALYYSINPTEIDKSVTGSRLLAERLSVLAVEIEDQLSTALNEAGADF